MSNEVFESLNKVDVSGFTEKKGKLTYLSWANAWAETVKRFPDAAYTVERYGEHDLPYVYDPQTGYMVSTTVTIGGITREMWLPVMDYRNATLMEPGMTDINKTIMRCLTKNLAMFGLGLYIYKGEDLPDDADRENQAAHKGEAADIKRKHELEKKPIGKTRAKALEKSLSDNGIKTEIVLDLYKAESLPDLTEKQMSNIAQHMDDIKKMQDKKEAES